MTYVVYRIRNRKNGRVYFGSTNNFAKRQNEHLKVMRGKSASARYMRDILQYGHTAEDFEFRVIARFGNSESMLSHEQKLLNMYWGTADCYNLSHEVTIDRVVDYLIAWKMEDLEVRNYLSCHAVAKDLKTTKDAIREVLKGSRVHLDGWVVELMSKSRTVEEIVGLYKSARIDLPAYALLPMEVSPAARANSVTTIAGLVNRQKAVLFNPSTGEPRHQLQPNHQHTYLYGLDSGPLQWKLHKSIAIKRMSS